MLQALVVLFILILLIAVWLYRNKPVPSPSNPGLLHVKSNAGEDAKKVILIVIDSLMAEAIDKGMAQKELPTLQYLIGHGQYYKEMVSSFPTMSVTIDSSLLTGTYPDGHHVPGLTWYSLQDKKLINYGTGPAEVIDLGVNSVMAEALIHLNGRHLNPELPTIYEDLARIGKKTGSINGLIYRGPVEHTLSLPAWMHGPTPLPKSVSVQGPDYLALGSLADPLKGLVEHPDGVTQRLGINNDFSLSTASYLIKENKLPDFLLVYLPDLDPQLHKHGPPDLKGVKETDRHLQALLESFGSFEEALQQAKFVIVGDNGMSEVLPAGENPVIELSSLLKAYNVYRKGDAVTEDTEIVLAVNDAMAYVYSLQSHKLEDIAAELRADSRIDLICWREGEWIRAQGADSKEVRYKANGDLQDAYGQNWTVEQEPSVLDLMIDPDERRIQYGRYPDAMRRLHGALHSHAGEYLVVIAKPGYELSDKNSPSHKGGGSHGSLVHADSLVPLIISGTDERPEHLRIVDLKAFLLKLVAGK
ncbi:alkaline phosphatase family protein [Paenibacillus ihumii]|uniref:alkaline phosphatase family protein n=1 Tax=Paenibacillus ihumii TaxID=687436 RepID=UPI0006D833CF|nr:alkaline phosphatase family protein [Paenibacillus ihumii]